MTSTKTLVGEDSPAVGTREILPMDLVGAIGERGAAIGKPEGDVEDLLWLLGLDGIARTMVVSCVSCMCLCMCFSAAEGFAFETFEKMFGDE